MIDAINDMCVSYGRQMRRAYLGGYITDTGFHFDGSSPRSVMDRIWEGPAGFGQKFPEVLKDDALAVRRAMQGMIEHRVYLVDLHYILPKRFFPTKRKVQTMCDMFPAHYKNKRNYYENIDKAHVWIQARVPREEGGADLVRTEYLHQTA